MLSNIVGHSGELCVSSYFIGSPSSVQVSSTPCHRSIDVCYSDGTLLVGGSLAYLSSQHIGRHSSVVSYCKKPQYGCIGGLNAQGSAIAAFNPLATQRCMLC